MKKKYFENLIQICIVTYLKYCIICTFNVLVRTILCKKICNNKRNNSVNNTNNNYRKVFIEIYRTRNENFHLNGLYFA